MPRHVTDECTRLIGRPGFAVTAPSRGPGERVDGAALARAHHPADPAARFVLADDPCRAAQVRALLAGTGPGNDDPEVDEDRYRWGGKR